MYCAVVIFLFTFEDLKCGSILLVDNTLVLKNLCTNLRKIPQTGTLFETLDPENVPICNQRRDNNADNDEDNNDACECNGC